MGDDFGWSSALLTRRRYARSSGRPWCGVSPAVARTLCSVCVVAAGFLAAYPAVASAEPLCTDTWVGASEGAWNTGSNWSSGNAPKSTDVACIGSGKTAVVSEAGMVTGVIQGKGRLLITAGKLEVSNALESSHIASVALKGGNLGGPAQVNVSESFSGGSGSREKVATFVLESGATGTIANEKESPLKLENTTLTNEGTLTIPKMGAIMAFTGAAIANSGTLIVNSEVEAGENRGLTGSTDEGTFTNTGTLKKAEGAWKTECDWLLDNEGSVVASAGKFIFTGAGESGVKATGSWTAGSEAAIVLDAPEKTTSLGSTVPITGTFEVWHSVVKTGTIEGAAASVVATNEPVASTGSHLEINGTTASVIKNLTVSAQSSGGKGWLRGSGEIHVTGSFVGGETAGLEGSAPFVIEAGAKATISNSPANSFNLVNRTITNDGVFKLEREAGLKAEVAGAEIVNNGTMLLNGENTEANHGFKEAGAEVAVLKNYGKIEKSEGEGGTHISWPFYNYGQIVDHETTGKGGSIVFENEKLNLANGNLRGCEAAEAAAEEQEAKRAEELGESEGEGGPRLLTSSETDVLEKAAACKAVTGAYTQSQIDFAIGGRGLGLDLVRSYNSQAAKEGIKGIFGYGWSSSYTDHLLLEPEAKRVTVVQSTGDDIPFVEATGETFTAPAYLQDTLTGSSSKGYTLTLETQTTYKFSGTGHLESITDRNGNTTTITNNGSGNPETITDPAGRTLKLTYNGEGLVEKATDPMGHVVKYTYSSKQLKTVSQPASASLRWQFEYASENKLNEMTDARGGVTKITYTTKARVSEEEDPMKRVTKYEYNPFVTCSTNMSTEAKACETYSSNGRIVAKNRGVATVGATTESYTYDEAGDLLTSTDGNGHTTKYTYNGTGDRLSMADPDGEETKWTYDSDHDVLTTTQPDGETTTIKRDAHGNPEVEERPAPESTVQETKFKYGAHGEVESITNPLKHTTKYEYDESGDKSAEIDPAGDKRTWVYNEDSQETSTVSPRGHVEGAEESKYKTTTERDAHGWPLKVNDPLGHETKYTYDGDGNVETVTDAEGKVTTNTYNADNQLTKVREPDETVTETGYDGAGQVTSQTDGNKQTTTYVRNALEQITEVIDPLGRKTTKEYDAAGNLTAVKDALKRTTTYTYDPANRLTEVSYSDGKTHSVVYEYNGDGLMTKMVDGTGTTKYTYDQLDRLTEAKDGHGDVVDYEYNLGNQQTKITYPNGKAVTRAYDSEGRLESVTDWLEHTTKFSYDADSNLTTTTFPSGTSDEDTYGYDRSDAVSEIGMKKGAETLVSLAYTRDKDARITKAVTKGLPGEEEPTYEYDPSSRLTAGAGTSYKYDHGNNPEVVGADTYKYDIAHELEKAEVTATKASVATYSYDEVGERTKLKPAAGPATTYEYDQAGNLIAVTRPEEGEVKKLEDSYTYNGEGLRASQTISGTTSNFAWDTNETLPVVLTDGTNSYIYGADGSAIEQISGTTPTYLHHDQQGSTRLLTGSSGTATGSITFDAYGNKIGSTGTATTPLGYDGQYTDADTGLIYLRARFYDPSSAQFVSSDPALAVSLEPYTFALDDPVTDSDLTGLMGGCPSEKDPCWKQVNRHPKAPYKRNEGTGPCRSGGPVVHGKCQPGKETGHVPDCIKEGAKGAAGGAAVGVRGGVPGMAVGAATGGAGGCLVGLVEENT